ncbi:hypothetical protein U9M48_014830 [Paspalum notatum var. saurae]|uniref:Uncharacterized protein n=1 Tax=Paspalum notatum var. saurae TaxID=547442 RepID=A0AAQ3T2U4_PASNO
MDVEDEGGGAAKNQNSVLLLKSEAMCTNSDPLMLVPEPVKNDEDDTTECSSSFGDTCSRFEDGADDGEPEKNSGMCAHANGGGPSKTPRRKKVTDEWRNCVRPVMWRCHWLELRMKELSSQVSKYDRELALISKEKELQQAVSKANGFMSESMQIDKSYRSSIMKRRKRKMHEENVYESFYINKHHILSYYHDKQNKGAETDGPLIDDNCGSTVGSSIRGVLDTATLLDSEDYDMILGQLTLKDILLTIDGVQSQVHLLQDRLNKAHSEGENLAFSEDNTHFRAPRKRQHTKKRPLSYTKCQYTKPQKKKNLNILLKDDDGSALAGRPAFPDRETDTHVKDANRNAEERRGVRNLTREKTITVNLLLGTDNSIPNGNIADLWKEINPEFNIYCISIGKIYLVKVATREDGRILFELSKSLLVVELGTLMISSLTMKQPMKSVRNFIRVSICLLELLAKAIIFLLQRKRRTLVLQRKLMALLLLWWSKNPSLKS